MWECVYTKSNKLKVYYISKNQALIGFQLDLDKQPFLNQSVITKSVNAIDY